jgi:hypothetical protein
MIPASTCDGDALLRYSPSAASPRPVVTKRRSVHTVFSIENKPYHRWQAELLRYSHERSGQPGRLTCLVSGPDEGVEPIEGAFHAPSWSWHPVTGDYFPFINKPVALAKWLTESPPEEETILLVDPDFVFLSPFTLEAEEGKPHAQRISYMTDSDPGLREHCARPERIQPVGVPIVIHRHDLAWLAPHWIARTEQLRADEALAERLGVTAEMWAYALVSAELGLEHQLGEIAAFNTEDREDLPLVHYCYAVAGREDRWSWGKSDYEPWERVDHPRDVPRAAAALFALINERASISARRPAG